MKKILSKLYRDNLFRNSIYLMLNTGIMAFLGFFFWIINARLFTTAQVGLATTMLSALGLITSFSLFGFDSGLIHYLPLSKTRNKTINTCFLIAILITTFISISFILGIKTFSPQLAMIRESLVFAALFVFFAIASTASSLVESVFIAYRDAKYVLFKNLFFSVFKLIFPVFLVFLGAYGILSSWMVSLAIGVAYGLFVLWKNFSYKPEVALDAGIMRRIGWFSFGNYIASFFNVLPSMLLPLMIINLIGPEAAAFYYMAMMIAGLLFIIPQATSQSLFAEGSHNNEELNQYLRKAAKIVAAILIPGILATVFLGKYILLVFGKDYSNGGFEFMQLLALSGVFVAINSILATVLKVRHRIKSLIAINFFGSGVILGLSYLFIEMGLVGFGFAWIAGQAANSLVYWLFFMADRGLKPNRAKSAAPVFIADNNSVPPKKFVIFLRKAAAYAYFKYYNAYNPLHNQYLVVLKKYQKMIIPDNVISGIFDIYIDVRGNKKMVVKIPKRNNLDSFYFCYSLKIKGNSKKYRRILNGLKDLPYLNEQVIPPTKIYGNGGYESDFIEGFNLKQLMCDISRRDRVYDEGLFLKVRRRFVELIDNLENFNREYDHLPGDWPLHNLMYDTTNDRIVNVDLEGFYTFEKKDEVNDLDCLKTSYKEFISLLDEAIRAGKS